MRTSVFVASFVALAAGCGKKSKITDVKCEAGAVPGVNTVTWKTELEGSAHVEYGLEEGKLGLSTPGVTATAGSATLLGLKVAEKYFVQVVVDDEVSELAECTTEPPPVTAPVFTLTEWNPDLACEDGGFFLFNYLGERESGVGIVDRDGRYVWAVESDANVQFARARLGRDGRSILWNTNDYDRVEDIATVDRTAIDGSTTTSTRTVNGHHDFLELPDGTIAFIGYADFLPPNEVEAAGFDIAALGFPVDGANDWDDLDWAYDVIKEVPEGAVAGDVPTVVFDHLRDWPEGVYHNHFNFSEKCRGFLPDQCELGHANSLAYVPSEDRYTIGFRWLDGIVNLDRTGAVQWVLGGPQTTLAGPEEDLPMHAHFSEAYAGGMRVFDNRDNDPPTRLIEYAIDGATFSTTWSYEKEPLPGAEPVADKVLGDVRQIPIEGCDNVLVSWSSDGQLQERTRDGQIVWEVGFSTGNITGRVQYLSSIYDFSDQAYPE